MHFPSKPGVMLALLAGIGALTAPAHAQINGFNNGVNFTVNSVNINPAISSTIFEPTDGRVSVKLFL